MARTVRRKEWYPVVKGFLGKKKHRDASCKPGCVVCGKPFHNIKNRKDRHTWSQRQPEVEGVDTWHDQW